VITTTYKCDFRGAEQSNPGQFWHVSVNIRESDNYPAATKRGAHACRVCAERMGLLPFTRSTPEPRPTVPTLEELLREVLARLQVG